MSDVYKITETHCMTNSLTFNSHDVTAILFDVFFIFKKVHRINYLGNIRSLQINFYKMPVMYNLLSLRLSLRVIDIQQCCVYNSRFILPSNIL